MNWLDTQTKALLQKLGDEKLAPPKAAEFALVLLQKGKDHARLIQAISQINRSERPDAARIASRVAPVTINPDLTEEEALWGQFLLICCDSISIFLRSEVLEQNENTYLAPLFEKVLCSAEFRPTRVTIVEAPRDEPGQKFIEQFLGSLQTIPLTQTVSFKKARIMDHWAQRVGVQMKID